MIAMRIQAGATSRGGRPFAMRKRSLRILSMLTGPRRQNRTKNRFGQGSFLLCVHFLARAIIVARIEVGPTTILSWLHLSAGAGAAFAFLHLEADRAIFLCCPFCDDLGADSFGRDNAFPGSNSIRKVVLWAQRLFWQSCWRLLSSSP